MIIQLVDDINNNLAMKKKQIRVQFSDKNSQRQVNCQIVDVYVSVCF